MTERSKSKSRLFFIEILIIIVFFSICAGVCMNLFAKAKLISVESSDLTKGVMVAQAAAEAVKAGGFPRTGKAAGRLPGRKYDPGLLRRAVAKAAEEGSGGL